MVSLKKELKGFITGVLITSIFLLGIPSFAASVTKSISASINSVKIELNGKVVSVDNITYNGSTYVKLTKFCDLIGKTVSWDSRTKTADVRDKVSEIPAPKDIENKDGNPVANDTTKPLVSEVKSITGNEIEITFNEKMDKTTVENIINYTIYEAYGAKSAVQISKAVIDATDTKVTLTTAGHKAFTLYKLEVNNLTDLAGNIIDKDVKTYVGMKSEDAGNPSDPNSGDLTVTSINTTSSNTIEVVFSNKLDETAAESIANYSAHEKYGLKSPITILSAELDSTRKKVILTTSEPKHASLYNIEVSNIIDIYGNVMSNYSQAFVSI